MTIIGALLLSISPQFAKHYHHFKARMRGVVETMRHIHNIDPRPLDGLRGNRDDVFLMKCPTRRLDT